MRSFYWGSGGHGVATSCPPTRIKVVSIPAQLQKDLRFLALLGP
jgi:hypothetical protein